MIFCGAVVVAVIIVDALFLRCLFLFRGVVSCVGQSDCCFSVAYLLDRLFA